MENETETLDSPNEETTEEVAETTEETTEPTDEVDDVDTLKEQNKKLFARAKKAEGYVLKDGEWVKKSKPETKPEPKEPKTGSDFSISDVRALNNVHDEDVEKVQTYAKNLGVGIAEAMKDEDLQAIIANREEKRTTAEATNTGGNRKGQKTGSDKELLSRTQKGDLGLSDEELQKAAELEIEAMRKS